MKNKAVGTLVLLLFFIVMGSVTRLSPALLQVQNTQQNSPSSHEDLDIPQDSVPQYEPCSDQTKTFKDLSVAYARGRVPLRTDMVGSWVMVGSWGYKNSRPDLNCTGIRRGKIFEWVMIVDNSSFFIDMVGAYIKTELHDVTGGITFTVDLQGDDNPVLECRMSRQKTLVCLGAPYYSGTEFKKIPVSCDPVTPAMLVLNQARNCFPGANSIQSSTPAK